MIISCPQCKQEANKHPDYKLCVACGRIREERRVARGCSGIKSREEQSRMRGFSPLSQEFLLRKLV